MPTSRCACTPPYSPYTTRNPTASTPYFSLHPQIPTSTLKHRLAAKRAKKEKQLAEAEAKERAALADRHAKEAAEKDNLKVSREEWMAALRKAMADADDRYFHYTRHD